LLERFAGKSAGEIVRYVAVGGFNTLFGYGTFAGFTFLLTGRIAHAYMAAYVLSNVVSITMAFVLYKRFVFRTTGNALREFMRVNVVYAGTALLGFVLLPLLVHAVGPVVGNLRAPYLASALLVPITVIAGYVGHKRFSFRTGRPEAPTPESGPARSAP
jgi:putative flippase GtrA